MAVETPEKKRRRRRPGRPPGSRNRKASGGGLLTVLHAFPAEMTIGSAIKVIEAIS